MELTKKMSPDARAIMIVSRNRLKGRLAAVHDDEERLKHERDPRMRRALQCSIESERAIIADQARIVERTIASFNKTSVRVGLAHQTIGQRS